MPSKTAVIEIDMDKTCKCGEKGALQNGLCLKCAGQKAIEKIKREKPKSMMLNQRNFEIAKLASKDPDDRAQFQCILVAPDKTVVTEGHLVLEVTGFQHAGDLLPFEDLIPQQDFEPFLVPAEEALALSKLFVRSDNVEANLIGIDPNTAKGAGLALRQLGSEKVFKVIKPPDRYPNYDAMFPPIAEEQVSITVNAQLLIPLLQQLAKINPLIRIGIYGPEKPIRLDCNDEGLQQSARGLLMPMKA
ncbi:MAG: hypothetical protein V1685_04890 [Parcubacteria group bacterium]